MIVGRVIAGFGNGMLHFILHHRCLLFGLTLLGMNTATIPVYNTEISRTTNRGRDLAFGQAMLIAGLTISYWFGVQFCLSQVPEHMT